MAVRSGGSKKEGRALTHTESHGPAKSIRRSRVPRSRVPRSRIPPLPPVVVIEGSDEGSQPGDATLCRVGDRTEEPGGDELSKTEHSIFTLITTLFQCSYNNHFTGVLPLYPSRHLAVHWLVQSQGPTWSSAANAEEVRVPAASQWRRSSWQVSRRGGSLAEESPTRTRRHGHPACTKVASRAPFSKAPARAAGRCERVLWST